MEKKWAILENYLYTIFAHFHRKVSIVEATMLIFHFSFAKLQNLRQVTSIILQMDSTANSINLAGFSFQIEFSIWCQSIRYLDLFKISNDGRENGWTWTNRWVKNIGKICLLVEQINWLMWKRIHVYFDTKICVWWTKSNENHFFLHRMDAYPNASTNWLSTWIGILINAGVFVCPRASRCNWSVHWIWAE